MTDERLTALYRQYGPVIYARCCRLLGDRAAAEDATQETFMRVHRHLDKAPAEALAWIYRIATNTCYDVLRRRRLIAWLPWMQDHGAGAAAPDDNPGERYAMREEVVEALRLVPPSLRAPLLLHALHGFCYADIAAALGISEAAVKMRISRARAAFRQAYHSADEEERP